MWWFDTCILQKDPTIRLVNTLILSHNYDLCMCGNNIKIYSLNNFHVYNTVFNYSYHPRTYPFYSWQFVPSDYHVPIPSILRS